MAEEPLRASSASPAATSSSAGARPPRSAIRKLFRGGFYLLDALLVGLFALACVSGYLPLGVLWWAEIVAIGLPYLGMLLVPALLVTAWRRRRALLALHVGLLLLALWQTGLAGRLLHRAQERPGDLTVLTLNLPATSSGSADPGGVPALVRSLSPEVVCLQEANVIYYASGRSDSNAPYLRVLLDSLGYEALRPDVEGTTYSPQPLLSRIPAESHTSTWLHYRPDDPVALIVTRVRLRWQERPFVLYNLHLRSFGERKPWHEADSTRLRPGTWRSYLEQYHEAFRIRDWEVRHIRAMIDRETLPVVVCGDFNSTPYNRAYRHLARGLRDAFRVAGTGPGTTYHSRLPFARIDFVLASPAWDVVSARVPAVRLSDHRPVVARLRWRE